MIDWWIDWKTLTGFAINLYQILDSFTEVRYNLKCSRFCLSNNKKKKKKQRTGNFVQQYPYVFLKHVDKTVSSIRKFLTNTLKYWVILQIITQKKKMSVSFLLCMPSTTVISIP